MDESLPGEISRYSEQMADVPNGGVDLQFEWDDDKAASNLEKHGVVFEEAVTVFRDPFALIFDDEAHSIEEQREIIIGHSTRNRLLLVCFTERGEKLRIFSARPATRKERQDYERHTNL
jgi:uncharacterized DUF497 family protein